MYLINRIQISCLFPDWYIHETPWACNEELGHPEVNRKKKYQFSLFDQTYFWPWIHHFLLGSKRECGNSGFAGRRPAKPVLKQGTRKKSVTTTYDGRTTTDGRQKHTPPFMGAQFSFWSFFSRFGPMSDFFVSQKVFSRQNSMLLAWLEVISHYQLSSPVHW